MTDQNHFTLSFPLKSPADAKLLPDVLAPLMQALFQAQDAIGRIHALALHDSGRRKLCCSLATLTANSAHS